jgi:hypothetical protein
MTEVIFVDESVITDMDKRARVNTDVIPRVGDWVVIPGEEHAHLKYHVLLVCIDYALDPPQVQVNLDESRARH